MNDLFLQIPYYWQPSDATSVEIECRSEEFRTIGNVVSKEWYRMVTLTRQQHRHRYVMFYIREKFLMSLNPEEQYYRVRKYVRVPASIAELALESNLDKRRCNYEFVFHKHIGPNLPDGYLIFIVCVVTCFPNSDVLDSSKNSDYFIEYVCRVTPSEKKPVKRIRRRMKLSKKIARCL